MSKSKRNSERKILAGLALLALTGGVALDYWRNREPDIEKYIPIKVDGKILQVPDYNLNGAACAQGARMLARDLFGMNYAVCNGWERPEKDDVVARVENFDELEKLAEKGKLRDSPMIVARYENSGYNQSNREGTHNIVYLGENPEGEILYWHFFGGDSRIETATKLGEMNISPRVVVAPKN
jgi:hypothetical protein